MERQIIAPVTYTFTNKPFLMRKLKLKLLLAATLGLCLAYTNKPHYRNSVHKYAFKNMQESGTKYYYTIDLTLYNYTKGIDYDCLFSYNICTFLADPFKSHTDAS